MPALQHLPPLGMYVHIPWCVRKCPYCDFNSHEANEIIPESAYIEALFRDLEQDLPRVWGRKVISVFIGGGTPSLFSPEGIERLLSGLRARLPLLAGAEITLEANPGTVDSARFTGFRAAGINRLSMGIQSFDDAALQRLGRIHGRREALAAITAAKSGGFENINLDLMFGLPLQTRADALQDLYTALTYSPTHVSWYQLTLEPNTAFYHRPPVLPDDEAIWAMQCEGQEVLASAGYHQYEVSAYAGGPLWHCQHNLNYWQFGDYLGIGAGAHSKISDAGSGTITRLIKQRQPHHYLQSAGQLASIIREKVLDNADLHVEFMLNALRLNDGFRLDMFSRHTGLPSTTLMSALNEAVNRGWLLYEGETVKPTALGSRFLNDVIVLFMGS